MTTLQCVRGICKSDDLFTKLTTVQLCRRLHCADGYEVQWDQSIVEYFLCIDFGDLNIFYNRIIHYIIDYNLIVH